MDHGLASKKDKSANISKFKRKRELNLGMFLFAIVFIYLIVTIVMYFSNDNISVYEVREGSIVRDTSYTGLIIREETAVSAQADGYVSYYQNENTKVKAGTNIYALSSAPLNTNETVSSEEGSGGVDPPVLSGVILLLQNFNENYRSSDFSSVYSLGDEIDTSLQDTYRETRMQHLDAAVSASSLNVTSYASEKDGIVAFTVDGMESLTKDTFTDENFDNTEYENTVLSDQMEIDAGDPVYRLITSEDWSVIVRLDKETAESLTKDDVTSIRVRVDKDSETMWADFSVIQRNGGYYGCLDFNDSMIRYAGDRFLNIELILEDESGLKIPRSSVVEEDFYVIPQEYLTGGGNSSDSGFLVSSGDGGMQFKAVDIYDVSEDGEIYVSRDDLDVGDVLIQPESDNTFTVGVTKSLQGVYNINRGYAVFKKVSILCENDEYYIVEEGEDYGLYNYDHIVQNGSGVSPDEVVFQ